MRLFRITYPSRARACQHRKRLAVAASSYRRRRLSTLQKLGHMLSQSQMPRKRRIKHMLEPKHARAECLDPPQDLARRDLSCEAVLP